MSSSIKSSLASFILVLFALLFLAGCPFLRPNNPPSLSIPNQLINENETLTVNLLKYADDSDNDPLVFEHIDGVGEVQGNDFIFHTDFGDAGQYKVKIRVTDWREGVAEDSFTITVLEVNRPPNIPLNPSPNNLSAGQPLDASLSWYCSDPDEDKLFYDVYFWKEDDHAKRLFSNIEDPEMHIEELDYSTRYFWQVIAKDDRGGVTTGPVWGFRTIHSPEDEYLKGMVIIAAGSAHTVSLREDGTVWAWGNNEIGQLGNGTAESSPIAVQVIGDDDDVLTGIVQICAGEFHTVALKKDGTVWAWGCNWYGQLGDGTNDSKGFPVQVKGLDGVGFLTGVVGVAAGGHHSLAVKDDGTVWAWGNNLYGQLGDGETQPSNTPVQVKAIPETEIYFTGVVRVAAGFEHTLALKDDGTVWTWGRNHYGQLGNGNSGIDQFSVFPVRVVGPTGEGYLSGITAVEAGWVHSVALRRDGTVWTWGRNLYGQLGDGTNLDNTVPVQVLSSELSGELSNITELSAGYQHTVALQETGIVWTWGKNEYGQLGDGTVIDKNSPVEVMSANDTRDLPAFSQIASGWDHTVALAEDGSVWTWGKNASGQLGNGEMCQHFNKNRPVRVLAPEDWYLKDF